MTDTFQVQLRRLTTGGPGVTHIASETLFTDVANYIDGMERAIESWKREEQEWDTEREQLAARIAALELELAVALMGRKHGASVEAERPSDAV